MIKILLFSCFYFLQSPFIPGEDLKLNSCDKISLEAELVQPNHQSGYKVKLTADGGQRPYKYIFCNDSGRLISEDFDKVDYDGLSKGIYFSTVIDSRGCKKTIEIEIK